MKRTILSLAVIATLSLSSFAQGHNKEKRQDIPRQLQELNLTEQQGKQIKDLGEQYRDKRKALNDEFNTELKSILTPEQLVAWEAKEKGRENNRGNKNNRGRNRHHRNKNIDAASKEKLQVLRQDYREKRSSIEKSRVAPDTQKEQLKALHDQYRKDVHEVMKTAKVDSVAQRPHNVQAFLDIAPSDKK